MKAKNKFTRSHNGQKATSNLTGKRTHAAPKAAKAPLTESVIVEATGNKTAQRPTEVDEYEKDNVIDIKRLAGL